MVECINNIFCYELTDYFCVKPIINTFWTALIRSTLLIEYVFIDEGVGHDYLVNKIWYPSFWRRQNSLVSIIKITWWLTLLIFLIRNIVWLSIYFLQGCIILECLRLKYYFLYYFILVMYVNNYNFVVFFSAKYFSWPPS